MTMITAQSEPPDAITLGEGVLSWPPCERHTDRYGTVCLDRGPDRVESVPFDTAPVGTHGHLVAVVLATRTSPHVGDWARGLFPTTPTVGEQILLGTGVLITGRCAEGRWLLGLRPDDGRDREWLDPAALYRCHHQTVRLHLRPTHRPERS